MPLIYFASQTGPALEVLLAGLLCFYGMLHFFSTLPGLNHRRLQAHLLFSLLGAEISHFSKHPWLFYWRMVFGNQDAVARCAHAYWTRFG